MQGKVIFLVEENAMTDNKNYKTPECFLPEEGDPYPLCIGQGMPGCEECQLREDWEPEDPYGVGA